MFLQSSKGKISRHYLPIFFILIFPCCPCTFGSKNTKTTRDLVSVWFNSPLPAYTKYSDSNLEVMMKVISEQFGGIAMDNVPILEELESPEDITNNRVLIPIVAAEHNKKSSSDRQIKVTVSFDLSPASGIADNPSYYNSFLVAKHYADEANKISPETVDTLLLHQDDYLRVNAGYRRGHIETPTELHSVKESLKNSKSNFKYKLGVTISSNLCLNATNGTIENPHGILSKFVENADIVVPVIHVKSVTTLTTACEEHEAQMKMFQTCEQHLRRLKPQVETIPIVICKAPTAERQQFFQCWRLMSDWALRNNRKVIMYEAFDRYNGEYVGGAGWWKLLDDRNPTVSVSSFYKKPQGSPATCELTNSTNTSSSGTNVVNATTNELLKKSGLNVTIPTNITKDLNTTGSLIPGQILDNSSTNGLIVQNNNSLPFQQSLESNRVHGNNDKSKDEGESSNVSYIVMIVFLILAVILVSVLAGTYYYKNHRNKASVAYSRAGDEDQYGLL